MPPIARMPTLDGLRRLTPVRILAAVAGVAGVLVVAIAGWLLAVPTKVVVSPGEKIAVTLPPAPLLSSRPKGGPVAQSLVPAPDPGIVEKGVNGLLPIIGVDGRQPWQVYARPFDRADTRPRIAVMMSGLGPSDATTSGAIAQLPGAVALAFAPAAQHLADLIDKARSAGHEVLLSLPMEPTDYPSQDPGPNTLLTSVTVKDDLDRLDWLLRRADG
jgi:hypothetical protein